MTRPVIARYRQIHGRTAEVLHPDTGRSLGVVGYTRKSAPEWDRSGVPGTWWYEGADSGVHGDGFDTREAAVRHLRGGIA